MNVFSVSFWVHKIFAMLYFGNSFLNLLTCVQSSTFIRTGVDLVLMSWNPFSGSCGWRRKAKFDS